MSPAITAVPATNRANRAVQISTHETKNRTSRRRAVNSLLVLLKLFRPRVHPRGLKAHSRSAAPIKLNMWTAMATQATAKKGWPSMSYTLVDRPDVGYGSEADGNLRVDCGPKEMGSFSLTRRDDYVVPVRNLRWQIQCCPF